MSDLDKIGTVQRLNLSDFQFEMRRWREIIEIEERRYLTRLGWKHTSQHGGVWLFEKRFANGVLALVDAATAFHLEASQKEPRG